jgi:hypothetical protein
MNKVVNINKLWYMIVVYRKEIEGKVDDTFVLQLTFKRQTLCIYTHKPESRLSNVMYI